MTGLPDYNYPAFNATAKALRENGFHVENPAENQPPTCNTREGWLKIALRQMLTCQTVVLLQGWEKSRGAKLEIEVACAVGLRILTLNCFDL